MNRETKLAIYAGLHMIARGLEMVLAVFRKDLGLKKSDKIK